MIAKEPVIGKLKVVERKPRVLEVGRLVAELGVTQSHLHRVWIGERRSPRYSVCRRPPMEARAMSLDASGRYRAYPSARARLARVDIVLDFRSRICDSGGEVSGARKGRAGGVRSSLASLFKFQQLDRADAVSVLLARFTVSHAVALIITLWRSTTIGDANLKIRTFCRRVWCLGHHGQASRFRKVSREVTLSLLPS